MKMCVDRVTRVDAAQQMENTVRAVGDRTPETQFCNGCYLARTNLDFEYVVSGDQTSSGVPSRDQGEFLTIGGPGKGFLVVIAGRETEWLGVTFGVDQPDMTFAIVGLIPRIEPVWHGRDPSRTTIPLIIVEIGPLLGVGDGHHRDR